MLLYYIWFIYVNIDLTVKNKCDAACELGAEISKTVDAWYCFEILNAY